MAVSLSKEEGQTLAKQFNDSFAAFQSDKSEDDRIQALKLAQRLVSALEKPQDAVYKMVYQVRSSFTSNFRIVTGLIESEIAQCDARSQDRYRYGILRDAYQEKWPDYARGTRGS
jgi:hypothetical protein